MEELTLFEKVMLFFTSSGGGTIEDAFLFFKEMLPLYIIFTPAAVVAISIFLVMMMTTPLDTEAARYKEYIKYVCWAWFILQVVPTFMLMCFNYAVSENAFTWAVSNGI